jgi:hypothetical protein
MFYRKTNITLLSIVAILLLLTNLVLIKFLFSDMKGFEWGSVTDWLSAFAGIISAIGTVATFWIAYKALKKHPNGWLKSIMISHIASLKMLFSKTCPMFDHQAYISKQELYPSQINAKMW